MSNRERIPVTNQTDFDEVIANGNIPIVFEGTYILRKDFCMATKNAIVHAYNRTTVIASEQAIVIARDFSTVYAYDDTEVRGYDSSVTSANDRAVVFKYHQAKAVSHDAAKIHDQNEIPVTRFLHDL